MIIPRESLGEFITELLCGWISLGHSEWTKAVGHVLCDSTGRTIGSYVCRFRGQWNSLKLELYVHKAAAKKKKKKVKLHQISLSLEIWELSFLSLQELNRQRTGEGDAGSLHGRMTSVLVRGWLGRSEGKRGRQRQLVTGLLRTGASSD